MIKIELLSETNFCLESLDSYNRKQNVNKVYRRIDGEYALVECKYTEDWDLSQKRSVAKQISSDDYITYIALENDKVVGFIGLLKKLNGPYMILDMMQVSSECRGQGVGIYRAMGSGLASIPIKELAEKEPYDLQMICPVID